MSASLQTVTLTADPETVRAYGELTCDPNPIHIDPEFAAKTSMGGCIAHGTMSICLLWHSIARTLGGDAPQNVDLDVRFIKPVMVGETIQAGGQLREGQPNCYEVWVRGEDGVVRMTGTAVLGIGAP